MKVEEYERKYERHMRWEWFKFLMSIVGGFFVLFSFTFVFSLALYVLFVDLVLFPVLAFEFPGLMVVLISPLCRYSVCSIVAFLAIFCKTL